MALPALPPDQRAVESESDEQISPFAACIFPECDNVATVGEYCSQKHARLVDIIRVCGPKLTLAL